MREMQIGCRNLGSEIWKLHDVTFLCFRMFVAFAFALFKGNTAGISPQIAIHVQNR